MKEIDCRGLPCPQPVIKTKNALEDLPVGETLVVLVDNDAAVKNVTRFAKAQGHEVKWQQEGEIFRLIITKKEKGPPSTSKITCTVSEETVVVLSSRGMGKGDPALSSLLLRAFLKTLLELKEKPRSIVCYNEGVFLALKDSEVIEDLQNLQKQGIKILVCGTCLDYYRVKEKLAVGEISNMYDIAQELLQYRVLKP